MEFDGKPGGGVASFGWEQDDCSIRLINFVPSEGNEPAHLAVDPCGRFLLVANYGSGSVAVFGLDEAGGEGAPTDLVQHRGRTPGSSRQSAPHPHQVAFDPVTGDVMVADLGLDAVSFNELGSSGRLVERESARILSVAGSGTRHVAFAPPGFTGQNQAAAALVSHSGECVFVSNHGHYSVAVFRFDGVTGSLTLVQSVPSGGAVPRDIAQSPDGRFLVVANQNSDNIVTFEIDEEGATLLRYSESAALTPVCLLFAARPTG